MKHCAKHPNRTDRDITSILPVTSQCGQSIGNGTSPGRVKVPVGFSAICAGKVRLVFAEVGGAKGPQKYKTHILEKAKHRFLAVSTTLSAAFNLAPARQQLNEPDRPAPSLRRGPLSAGANTGCLVCADGLCECSGGYD